MFCPKCSQEQASDAIKFCSRCGFALEDIAEALNNEGKVERKVIQSAKDLKLTTIKGVSIMSLGGIFLLISLILGTPEPSYFVQFNLLVGILMFLFGTAFIGYDFWIKPKFTEKNKDPETRGVPQLNKEQTKKLNEADVSNIASYTPPQTKFTTRDLVEQGSVTEQTTRNLKKEI